MLRPTHPQGQAIDDRFSFRSDRLSLDFAATLMFRESDTPPCELLSSPENLIDWARASGMLLMSPSRRTGVLGEAIELREAIYRSARTHIGGDAPAIDDIAVLNRHGTHPPLAVTLDSSRVIERSGTLNNLLATIARDTIELLGGPDAERLRQCGRSSCTRMFIDRSRGHTRVWCGMRECGNRVNAAAYRRRKSCTRPS